MKLMDMKMKRVTFIVQSPDHSKVLIFIMVQWKKIICGVLIVLHNFKCNQIYIHYAQKHVNYGIC